MGSVRLLEDDPIMQTRQFFIDNDDGSYTIATEHDDALLLESNQEERTYHRGGERWGEGRIHSRVPHWKLFELVKEGVLDPDMNLNRPRFTRWANSSKNVWKIRHGRI